MDGDIYAINPSPLPHRLYKLNGSGLLIWAIDMAQLLGGGFVANSSHIVDENTTLYPVASFTPNGNLHAIDKEEKLKWSLTVENARVGLFSKPAIAPDGRFYIAGDHTLNAVR